MTFHKYAKCCQDGMLAVLVWLAAASAMAAAPVASSLAPVDVEEDAANAVVDVTAAFSDPDVGDVLTYTLGTITDGTLFSSAGLAGGSLTLDFAPDANGSAQITIRATDMGGEWAEVILDVTVNAVNDTPTVAVALADVVVDEDAAGQSVSLAGAFDDVDMATDGDSLTYSSTHTNPGLFTSISTVGDSVNFTMRPNLNGSSLVTIRATDALGASVEDTFTISTTPVNDAPVVSGPIPDGTFTEDDAGGTVDLGGVFTDADAGEGDDLHYSIFGPTPPFVATATMTASGDLVLTFVADQNGTGTVTVRATDDFAEFADATVSIEVIGANDGPVAGAAIAPVTVDEDATDVTVSLAGAFDDPDIATDGDSLTYSVPGSTDPTLFTSTTVLGENVVLDFAPDANGFSQVTVRATDGSGASVDQTLDVTVTPANDAPVIAGVIPVGSFPEDTVTATVDLSGVFHDVDLDHEGDTLSYSPSGWPAFVDDAQMIGTTLELTLGGDRHGTGTVTVTASDAGGLLVDAVVSIEVTPVNDAPEVAAPIADVALDEDAPDQSVSLTGAFDDVDIVDGDALTYSIGNVTNASLFTAVTVAADSVLLDLAPDFNGSADVTVRATDSSTTAWVEDTFRVTVNAVNDAPVLTATPASGSFPEDTVTGVIDLSAVFDDVDLLHEGDNHVLTVTGFTGTTISGATITGIDDLEVTFVGDQHGDATVRVRATDNGGAFIESDVAVEVTPVNDGPTVVSPVSDITVAEDAGDHNVDLTGVFLDVDTGTTGDELTYTISGMAGGGLFTSVTPVGDTVVLDFAPDRNGTGQITVRATDSTGAFSEDTFEVVVAPVNDFPVVVNPIGDIADLEDGADVEIDISSVFDDVDIATNGDALTLAITGNSNPVLFDLVEIAGNLLRLDLAFDQNGDASIEVTATDAAGGFVNDTFVVSIAGVDDNPAATDDDVVMVEDSGVVSIPVLANDYLAELPTVIVSAGVAGESQGDPQVILDQTGNPIAGANGTVTIVGDEIQYEPKEHFFGDDFFTYTIRDTDGDVSTATVRVTVTAVNDPPTAPALRTYTVLENGILDIDDVEGLMFGAYDLEGALVGADGLPVGSSMTIQVVTFPADGVVSLDNVSGSFTYTPPVDFIGEVSMTYRVSDGGAQSEVYEARISVIEAPEAPEPPDPGEVATIWNLADVPLEQSTSVSPNVIVMMDDSGSMDWNISIAGNADGGFLIDNHESGWDRSVTNYFYLWDLPNNLFSWSSSTNGRILPTEGALEADSHTDDNDYGVWRARNHQYNRLYYNPQVRYTPWIGLDVNGNAFGNADPDAIRLDPRSSSLLFDMLADHDYESDRVPRTEGDEEDIDVVNLYIPMYYATTATPPLAWNDPHTPIIIKVENEPFTGGPARDDCAADDGDPMDCTYAQEIQNFANYFQYYRTREYAAKNGLGKVVSQVQDVRIGYETINDNYSEPVREMNDLHTEGNKATLLNEIYRTSSNGSTPLRRALDRAGDIFAGSLGDDPILPAPEGFCQQNFTLLFSDGYWNGSDPSQDNEDGDGSSDFDGGRYSDSEQETLADVAMYFYERDLRPEMDDLVPVGQRDRLGAPPGTFDDGTARMHQHMKTYTVAFGLLGSVDATDIPTDPTVAFAWPDPEDSAEGKIDDMLHAAVNGRGQFLSAVDPQELQSQLEAAFLEFTQAASSTSAAAFNSTSLQTDTLLYRGFYDLRDSTGELSAIEVNDDGTLGDTIWNASEVLDSKLPNARNLVTFDPDSWLGIAFRPGGLTLDQQLSMDDDEVSYIRGFRGEEQPSGSLRRRATTGGVLGDIVNSSPVFVGKPLGLDRDEAPWPTEPYSSFASTHVDRPGVVYVGANDGILHGFDAESGEELFGYIPNKIIDGSQVFHNDLEEFTSPFYQHKFFVDLTPRISDAYVSGNWRTILLGGLGAGGKGFFALDVTNPGSSFSSETNAAGTVLWEFTDEDDTSPNANLDPAGNPVKDLGYALTLPTLAMSNVATSGNQEWVAIFGNGPNSTAGIAKLFVLFMDRGLDGWDGSGDFIKLDTGRGVPIAPAQLAGYPNGLGTPALVDTDLNGTVDWVYAGDRLGNLYRFDLCNRDADGDCATNASGWSVTRLFTATYDDGGVDRLQPILSQPLVMKHPTEQGFLVIFGTGSYMTKEDADSEEIQSIYAIWDRGEASPATALDDSKELRLVEQTLTNVVDDSVSPAVTRRVPSRNVVEYEPDAPGDPGTFGWYIDLDMPRAATTTSGAANPDTSGRASGAQFPGEKAIRRFVLRNGALVTTTVLPSLDEFSCFGTRPGAILVLNALGGGDHREPIVDFNNDGVIDEGDLLDTGDGDGFAAGLLFNQNELDGALVDLSTLGGEGDMDWLFACGGNDCVPFRIEAPSDSRTGRLSWRELDPSN